MCTENNNTNNANNNEIETLKKWILKYSPNLEKVEDLSNLTELDLSCRKDLSELPDSIRLLTNLKKLSLCECLNLKTLPESIGELRELQELNLNWCYKIEKLPDSICELTNLKNLDLGSCYGIEKLPDDIGNLTELETLNLNGCKELKNLPESIKELTNLKKLSLCECLNLKTLPESIGELRELQELNLNWCYKIEKLPDSICELTNLKNLDLGSCYGIEKLPDDIGNLTELETLNLSGCKELKNLPESIKDLTSLKELYLRYCYKLDKIHNNITNIELLDKFSLLSIIDILYKKQQDKLRPNNEENEIIKKYSNRILELEKNSIDEFRFYAYFYLALIFCQEKNYGEVHNCIKHMENINNECGDKPDYFYKKEVLIQIDNAPNNLKKQFLDILLSYLDMELCLRIDCWIGYFEQTVAQYIKPAFAMRLLEKDENGKSKNPLQLSNITTFNDPKEGKVIFEYLNGLEGFKNNNIIFNPISKLTTFVGCFTFNHDKLNHFRLYGKEENKEATGVSLVLDTHFFHNQDNKNDDNENKLYLYRCLYLHPTAKLDKRPYIRIASRDKQTFYRDSDMTEEHWKAYQAHINNIQDTVIEQFDRIINNIQLLFKDINDEKEKEELIETVSFMLLPLSYMVKHSAYEEEQECRIFKFLFVDFNNPNKKIIIDTNNKRMYVEYLPIDSYVKKIYLSPYAEKYADMFRVLTNNKVEVRSSDNPFR